MHTCWPFIWPQIHSRLAYWKGGWLQRRSPDICHASPQPAGQIDFELRVEFTIGLNFELLLLRRPRSNNQITREKRKVFVKIAKWRRHEFRVWDWRALAFRSLQAWALNEVFRSTIAKTGFWKRTHFPHSATVHTNDSATCVLIMAMKIRRHELFIGQE